MVLRGGGARWTVEIGWQPGGADRNLEAADAQLGLRWVASDSAVTHFRLTWAPWAGQGRDLPEQYAWKETQSRSGDWREMVALIVEIEEGSCPAGEADRAGPEEVSRLLEADRGRRA